jgi:hypothetical protein
VSNGGRWDSAVNWVPLPYLVHALFSPCVRFDCVSCVCVCVCVWNRDRMWRKPSSCGYSTQLGLIYVF